MKYAILSIRFLLEICILISIGYWGYQFPKLLGMKIIFCILAPVLIAIIWGTFISPKAPVHLPLILYILMELIIFGFAFFALYKTGHQTLAFVFGIISFINLLLVHILDSQK